MNQSEFNILLSKIFNNPAFDIRFPGDVSAAESVEFLSYLFENPATHLSGLSRSQIAKGLQYLIQPCGSEMPLALFESSVPLDARLTSCVGVENLFKQIFAVHCKPALIHTSETDDEVNISCFMWWENFPTFFHLHTPEGDALQAQCEDVMRRILTIDSLACQESVIHGFGHLLEDRPEVAETGLNECVLNAALEPELREYARSMLTGGRV